VSDGTLIPTDHAAADQRFYSGKHRRHGVYPQVISAPDGEIPWVPGAIHNLTAARICGIARELATAGPIVLADNDYHGTGDHILNPDRGQNKLPHTKTPTAAIPGFGLPANAPTPSRKPGTSSANSAAAPAAPGSWPRPSTSFKPARDRRMKRLTASSTD
jgi:hypothetical protein